MAIHPDLQGRGLGTAIVAKLKDLSARPQEDHPYANPGKEGFYRKLGFKPMRTAMAIFPDQDRAIWEGFGGRRIEKLTLAHLAAEFLISCKIVGNQRT